MALERQHDPKRQLASCDVTAADTPTTIAATATTFLIVTPIDQKIHPPSHRRQRTNRLTLVLNEIHG
jgi:hypothetical protein